MANIKKDDFFHLSHESAMMPMEMPFIKSKKDQNFTLGIPAESLINENRVSFTPQAVKQLVNSGIEIVVESNAGKNAHYKDIEYAEAGARITDNKAEVYKCNVIVKVAFPTEEEINLFGTDSVLFSAINLQHLKSTDLLKLTEKRITAFGFEIIKDESGILPLMQSMSEIAGKAAIFIAAEYLSSPKGEGLLLGGITGVVPTEVIILGAGTVGQFAASTALALGADVKVFDNSLYKLRRLNALHSNKLFNSVIQNELLNRYLKTADVVIGALRPHNGRTPCVVSEDMVMQMKENAVIVDISIDHGGCFETSKVTGLNNPVFTKHGVIHYCVPNIASAVPQTASVALSNILTSVITDFRHPSGLNQYLWEYPYTRHGIYMYKGILTSRSLGLKFNMDSKAIDLLLASNL